MVEESTNLGIAMFHHLETNIYLFAPIDLVGKVLKECGYTGELDDNICAHVDVTIEDFVAYARENQIPLSLHHGILFMGIECTVSYPE